MVETLASRTLDDLPSAAGFFYSYVGVIKKLKFEDFFVIRCLRDVNEEHGERPLLF